MTITAGSRPGRPTDDTDAVGPYRLVEHLGGGVFRARDTVRRRAVALELPEPTADPAVFRLVARTAARLCSPHVVPIHDFGVVDGRPFLAVRLVPGTDLAAEIARRGPLPARRVAAIVRQVADALDAAHADGLVHGGVTPARVLLEQRSGHDVVSLTGFGGASLGGDRGVDLRALADLLVEARTGRPAAADPELPPALAAVVERAARWPTAGAFADAAHRALTGRPTTGAPSGAPPVTPPRGTRYVAVTPAVPPAPDPALPRSPGSRWLALGAVTAVAAVAALLVALVGAARVAGDAPAPAAPTAPVAVAAGPLAAAFPDVARLGAGCAAYRPGPGEYVTSQGARPVAVIGCDHGATVPGASVYYTQWPTAADAGRWQADQAAGGPGLAGPFSWTDAAGETQGPVHTRAAPDGTIYTTAAYAERPYAVDLVTRSAEDARRLLPALQLLPAAQVPA
ncbi:hypothetical protein [Actinomycetospora chlora]|uniref:hypothetical protein n=1 Tax=Actinomycetospora chlora TaxID=663608 RepID=UPI0031E5F423